MISLRSSFLLSLLVAATGIANAQEVVVAPEPVVMAPAPVIVTDTAPASLAGCWSGSWLSCATGHKGPMQATFCQICPTKYEVTFRGRFFKFIPFRYTVTLDVVGYEYDRVLLAGNHKLGPIMGTFSYSAYATNTEFVANYHSKKDHGQFRMSRAAY